MAQIKKNQHFVPQSLIKNFSKSNDGVVNIYDSARLILRPPTTVNRVLSENYFYDRDNTVENFLANHVEGPAAPIFKDIAREPKKKIACNRSDLLRFITVQLCRTPGAFSEALKNEDNYTRALAKELLELNGFDQKVIDDIKFVLDDPRELLRRQTVEGVNYWPLINDLEWHVLINDTDVDFVLSDNPVAHYNWYLRDSNEMRCTSLTSCGVKIFLPISYSVTLCLYDKKIYKLGEKKSTFSILKDKRDVLLLNELQFRNRESYIVFSSKSQSDYIMQASAQITANSLYENCSQLSSSALPGGDKIKSTHVNFRKQVRINRWLSFCKIKRRVKKRQVNYYDRNPDLVESHKSYMESGRPIVYERQ